MSRTLWLTRGPRAGRFETLDPGRAGAIVDAGMGQDVAGLTDRQLRAAQLTGDAYPEPVSPGKPAARKATYRRRDLRAEE